MPWTVAGVALSSRLLLGTARYPSLDTLQRSIKASGTEILTVSLRRATSGGRAPTRFWEGLKDCGARLLPNTAGCRTACEAVATARLAHELFETSWVKLEVIGDDYTLQPDTAGTLEAAKTLVSEGFDVFAYTTEDLVAAQRLQDCGCAAVMPWASPIGTGRGLANPEALRTLRERLKDAVLIVDAGLGRPSDAARAMEMGFDAVLLNTAVSAAEDPPTMARAFALAIEAGRLGKAAGIMRPREAAVATTPVVGTPFWHQEAK